MAGGWPGARFPGSSANPWTCWLWPHLALPCSHQVCPGPLQRCLCFAPGPLLLWPVKCTHVIAVSVLCQVSKDKIKSILVHLLKTHTHLEDDLVFYSSAFAGVFASQCDSAEAKKGNFVCTQSVEKILLMANFPKHFSCTNWTPLVSFGWKNFPFWVCLRNHLNTLPSSHTPGTCSGTDVLTSFCSFAAWIPTTALMSRAHKNLCIWNAKHLHTVWWLECCNTGRPWEARLCCRRLLCGWPSTPTPTLNPNPKTVFSWNHCTSVNSISITARPFADSTLACLSVCLYSCFCPNSSGKSDVLPFAKFSFWLVKMCRLSTSVNEIGKEVSVKRLQHCSLALQFFCFFGFSVEFLKTSFLCFSAVRGLQCSLTALGCAACVYTFSSALPESYAAGKIPLLVPCVTHCPRLLESRLGFCIKTSCTHAYREGMTQSLGQVSRCLSVAGVKDVYRTLQQCMPSGTQIWILHQNFLYSGRGV